VADVFTKKKRSQVMAAIRSEGNKATELKLASILRAAAITGWRNPESGRHFPGRNRRTPKDSATSSSPIHTLAPSERISYFAV
jgi:hypothetical protein